MGVLLWLARGLGSVNAALLAFGRGIGIICVALMVVAILIQVWFRYVLNNALPWPDEASRFLMLWMTGLMAPTAFRRGGFVSIDMGVKLLPVRLGAVLSLLFLGVSLMVLVVGFRIGWSDVTGFGGQFKTASLKLPTNLAFSQWMQVPRSWMMASLATGITLLIVVNVELILRAVVMLFGAGDRLPVIAGAAQIGAE